MTRSAGIRAFLAVACVSAALAGCGEDDEGEPIPANQAQALEQQLDGIAEDVSGGDCEGATTKVAELRTDVDGLDDAGVGRDVQDAIGDGVDNLSTLIAQECEPEEEPVETVPEETVPEETIPEETTPEPTTPEPEPEPTTPEPTTPVPVPEEEPDEGEGGAQFGPSGGLPPGQAKKEGED